MSKALKTVGAIVGAVALVATGVGAIALGSFAGTLTLAGVSVQTLGYVGAGLAFLGDVTAKPLKVGTAAGSQVDFAADPNAPIPYAIGRTGTGGRIVHLTTGEAKNRNALYATVLSGAGPIEAFESFKAGDEGVTFSPLTEAASGGTYNLRMWQRRQLGAMPSGQFIPPNTTDGAVLGEWTSSHRLSGLAAVWHVLGYDQKTYPNGTPPAVWTIKGVRAYDPRLDDTYPGGVGDQRIDDPATWSWTENPWLHGLTWCLGRYANGVRVLGIGASPAAIDIPAFVEAANVADANGWKVGGVVYSTDSKWDAFRSMCQAGGGRPARLGATITVLVNSPRTALTTLTSDDIVGAYTVQAAQSVRARPNQIIPRYRSEAHGWEDIAAGPVKVPDYIAADGRLRSREVSYPLVQDAAQVAQLAAYDLVNAREFGPITVPCKPRWIGYKAGDCIIVNAPDLCLIDQKALILSREIDPMTGGVTLTLQSETDAKHDFALGRTASPPPVPGLTGSDPLPAAPTVGAWVAVGGVLAASDGSAMPAIIVTGEVDDPNATHLIVDYRSVLPGPVYGDWVGNEYPSSSERIEIGGVSSGGTYQVRVRYRTIRGLDNAEVSLDLGLVTAGVLVAANTVKVGDTSAIAIAAALAELRKAQIQIETLRSGAQVTIDALVRRLLDALDGKPLGPVLAEQRNVLVNTNLVVGQNTAAITVETLARQTAVSAEAYERSVLRTDFQGFSASATSQLSSLSTSTGATAASLTVLSADYGGFKSTASSTLLVHTSNLETLGTAQTSLASDYGGFKSTASSTLLTLSNGQSALASDVTSLSTDYNGFRSTTTVSLSSLSTAQSTTASSLTSLTSAYNGFSASASSQLSTLASTTQALSTAQTNLASTVAGNKALADQSISTLSTTTQALSTAQTNLTATVGGNTASISQVASAQVTTDGKVSAVVGFWLDVNGKVAGLRFANNGVTAGLTFNADYVQINGDLIVNGTITTGRMADGAISTMLSSEASWGMAVGAGSESTHLSYGYVSDGGKHLVSVYGEIGTSTAAQAGTVIRLYCDNVLVSQGYLLCPGNWGAVGVSFPGLHQPGPGYHTYEVRYEGTPMSGPMATNRSFLGIAELKK